MAAIVGCQTQQSGSPPVDTAELLEDAEALDCNSLRPLEYDEAVLEAPEVALLLCTAAVASASACMHISCWSAGAPVWDGHSLKRADLADMGYASLYRS